MSAVQTAAKRRYRPKNAEEVMPLFGKKALTAQEQN
jgi:hypothetical protein